MADSCLHISWDSVVPGREERAVEVFNETVGYYGRLQQEGKIESFDVVLLDPNAGIGGYFQLRGTQEQMDAAKSSDEFRDRMVDAEMIAREMCVVGGVCNEGIAREMERFTKAIEKVPQRA